jgi:hypothetical protein
MMYVWGSGGIAPVFLTWALVVGGQLHAPAALSPGEVPPPPSQYSLDRRLCGPHTQSGHYGKEKSLASTRN